MEAHDAIIQPTRSLTTSIVVRYRLRILDRRELAEIRQAARLELLRLAADKLQRCFPAGPLATGPRVAPVACAQPGPLRADHGRESQREQGDHQPAHEAILASANQPPGSGR